MDLSRLYDYGILQMGYFQSDDRVHPIQISGELIPSYPDLLVEVAQVVNDKLKQFKGVDRVVAMYDCISVATIVTTLSHIPLVYQHGDDFIGAYDVGHPACLIACTMNQSLLESTIKRGKRVGLDISSVIVLFGKTHYSDTIPIEAIFNPESIRAALHSVSAEQLAHVDQFLEHDLF